MSRRLRVALAAALCVLTAACGGDTKETQRTPLVRWYAAPESGDIKKLAEACETKSSGKYRIAVTMLPADIDERRELLMRRLRAQQPGIDLISVDSGFSAELGAAKLLAPVPEERIDDFSEDVFEPALAASTYDKELVSIPWWQDPYLLWYRKDAIVRTGLDPKAPITWKALIDAAAKAKAPIAFADADGRGLAAWVNALVVASGGQVVEGSVLHPASGLDTEAGTKAAELVASFMDHRLNTGPSAEAASMFASPAGAFLLAPSSVILDPSLAPIAGDLGWAPYPIVDEKKPGVGAPLIGMSLGVPLFATHPGPAYDVIECLTGKAMQRQLLASSGHGAARMTAFSGADIARDNPLAVTIGASLAGGAIEPVTPFWHLARRGIVQTWNPLDEVSGTVTPRQSDDRVTELMSGAIG